MTGRHELAQRPILRPGEVLESVPGLIISQHSGDGKANQYYLRGFNLDHGTDFRITVDDIPINLPSHGHGQGYSDLNFLIPELVDSVRYRKGLYYADEGDFSAAGAATISYVNRLDRPLVEVAPGSNGYPYGQARVRWASWLRTVAGLRADYFRFRVASNLPANSVRRDNTIVSPKLSFLLGPWQLSEVYLNFGEGFHSNDARGTVVGLFEI